MRIAIEAQRIFRSNKHGMDFVALESIRELQKIDKENEYYIFVSPGEDRCLEETSNMHIIEINCPTYPLWEQIALPRAVAKVKPDLLHCTSNTAPIFCSVPLILTLHDIIFLEPRQSGNKSWYQNMGWYYRRFVVPRILSKCKKIITVSNFECNRIKNALHLSDNQITAIYNGYNKHFCHISDVSSVTKKYMDEQGYLFFLGNTDPKKNVPRTLKAYSLYLKKSEKKRPLLIADLKEDKLDIILKEQGIEYIKPYLVFPGYIPNKDLAYLYNGAFAFLYTSLRESFGIPILEAMACGTPVIAGNTSAMPEIVGEGGILVNPFIENEIVNKLLLLEEDPLYYEKQIMYGRRRINEFSWKKTAESLITVYNNITTKK